MEAEHFYLFFTEKRIVQFKCLVCSDLPFVAVTLLLLYFERLESILFQGPQKKTRICLVVVVVDLLCSCIHECNRKTAYNVQNQ